MPLKIELDIFSGRPNPTWALGERANAQLEAMIQGALPAQGNTNLPGLGYRGFILHRPETLRVYRGQIIREPADKVEKKEAAGFGNRELELWLLQTAKTHIDPALWDIVRDALR